jgi:hypothetical protein
MTELEENILAVELNITGRVLNEFQRVQFAESLLPMYEARAKERQEDLGRTHGGDPSGSDEPKGRAADQAAKAAGVGSRSTFERKRDLLEKIKNSSLGEALFLLLEPGESQRRLDGMSECIRWMYTTPRGC